MMKSKNISLVERHIEKALLALAALFVVWVAYSNFVKSPNAVPNPTRPEQAVTPSDVGATIDSAVQRLKAVIKEQPRINANNAGGIPDYVAQYQAQEQNPLPNHLISVAQVAFAPLNLPVLSVKEIKTPGMVFNVPQAPALVNLQVSTGRGVAVKPNSGNGAGSSTGAAAGATMDVSWVAVDGDFPMKTWLANLGGSGTGKIKAAPLPREYWRTTFYRVQVRRQERLPSGLWGPWVRVRGTYLSPLPVVDLSQIDAAGVAQALSAIDSQAGNILTPSFYTLVSMQANAPAANTAQPPSSPPNVPIPQPFPGGGNFPGPPGGAGFPGAGPGGLQQQLLQMQHRFAQRNNRPVTPPLMPGANPNAVGNPASGSALNNPLAAQENRQLQGSGSLSDMTTVPANFYDQTAESGHEYRYEMRVVLYNPVYRFRYKLTDPAMAQHPWIPTPWSKPSAPVKLSESEYFFLVSSQVSDGQVAFRIFKWVDGQWTVGDEYVSIGQKIGNVQSATLVDPNTKNLINKQVDFDTGYTLVDAHENANGNSVTVVVMNQAGDLTVRSSAWDANNPEQRKLNRKVARMGLRAPTAPAR